MEGTALLERLDLAAPYAARVTSLRRLIEALEFEIDLFAGMIRGRLARDPAYAAVQTIPGIATKGFQTTQVISDGAVEVDMVIDPTWKSQRRRPTPVRVLSGPTRRGKAGRSYDWGRGGLDQATVSGAGRRSRYHRGAVVLIGQPRPPVSAASTEINDQPMNASSTSACETPSSRKRARVG